MKTFYSLILLLIPFFSLQAQVNADFVADVPEDQCTVALVTFANTSTGDNLEFEWIFGDGTTSTEANPVHGYLSSNFYEVCLIAFNTVTQESDTSCQFIQVQFGYGDTTAVFYDLCPGDQVIIDGMIFDESNPTGVIVFQDQNGCDSALFYSLNFFAEVISNYDGFLCDGESVVVNGTTYDVSNPSGVEVIPGGSVFGCDSTIFVDFLLGLQVWGQSSGDLNQGNSVLLTPMINNGQGPYTYVWTDAQGTELGTDATLEVSVAGNYTVIVQDVTGCPGEYTFSVAESTDLMVQQSSSTTVICPGTADGFLSIWVANGIQPYTYSWDNNISVSTSVSNLTAGTYCVTVTDAVQNSGTACFGIIEHTLDISADYSAVVCQDEGYIDLTLSGNDPFLFFWSNNANTEDIDNLTVGNYNVTIVDNNDCSFVYEQSLISNFSYDYEIIPANCDTEDASIIFTGDNIDDYEFNWSTGAVGDSIGGLSPGGYNVTISDVDADCFVEETFIISEAADCFATITGNIWNDTATPDCIMDGNGGMPSVLVSLLSAVGVPQATFTDAAGNYEFTVDETGVYFVNVEIAGNDKFAGVCIDPLSVEVDAFNQVFADNDFYIEYTDYEDVMVLVVKGNARPGFTQTVNVMVVNVGAADASGTLTFNYSDVQNYVSASPAPASLNTGMQTMSWNYTDLAPGELSNYKVNLLTPIGTDLGTLLNYEVTSDGPSGDADLENNTATCELEVTGSYDPNDKQVTPMGEGPAGFINPSDSLLTYRIRFQNTGTDTAFTVVIRDTLSEHLDYGSLEPLGASHSYRTDMIGQNVVEFIFENILLPDSTVNEPASNGFVLFNIKLRPDLPFDTEITNRAGIYFDFNLPIITNRVINTIQPPDATFAPVSPKFTLSINPNPIVDEAVITLNLLEQRNIEMSLYDINGQLIRQVLNQSTLVSGSYQFSLSLDEELNGVYVLIARDELGQLARTLLVKI